MHTASRDDIKKTLNGQDHMVIVNVLPQEHYEKAHIPGSRHINYDDEQLTEKIGNMVGHNKNHKIAVYCANKECSASDKAAEKLEEAGYTNVFHYEAGMEDWQDAGEQVATIKDAA